MHSYWWKQDFTWKTYYRDIPGIYLAYPRKMYIPGIYQVYTMKKLSGGSRCTTLLLLHYYVIITSLLHVSLLHGHCGGLLLPHYYHYYMNSLLPRLLLPLLPLLSPPTWRWTARFSYCLVLCCTGTYWYVPVCTDLPNPVQVYRIPDACVSQGYTW